MQADIETNKDKLHKFILNTWGTPENMNPTWFSIRENDEILGAGSVEIRQTVAWLYSGIVHTKHRRKGVHQSLISARVDYARKMGVKEVFVSIETHNLPCLNSYRKMGFIPVTETLDSSTIHMKREI